MRGILALQATMAAIGSELADANSRVLELASNGAAAIEDVRAAKETAAQIQERFDIVKDEHARAQAEAQASLEADHRAGPADEKGRVIAAKAKFYRAVLNKAPIEDVRAALIAIPGNDASGGDSFLPTTLAQELIHEPFATNPLRDISPVTNITGLVLPRIAFEVDDDAFIGDDDVAAELDATGDTVPFGRFKTKVKATVADTVLKGSDVDLVTTIENALRSGLALKEKKVAFASVASQVAGQEHMSFYQDSAVPGVTLVKEVEGASLLEAILNSVGDLNDAFAENAKVVMRRADYISIVTALANGNAALFAAPPEQIIGYPVIFCDLATTPVVGDFNYFRTNYDIAPTYDTDKDVETGEYKFVLTAWFDEQRLLNSAFRLAVVTESV